MLILIFIALCFPFVNVIWNKKNQGFYLYTIKLKSGMILSFYIEQEF